MPGVNVQQGENNVRSVLAAIMAADRYNYCCLVCFITSVSVGPRSGGLGSPKSVGAECIRIITGHGYGCTLYILNLESAVYLGILRHSCLL